MVKPLRRKGERPEGWSEMEVLSKKGEKALSLWGGEVVDCDGVVVGSVVDGKVKAFVVEIVEELVEEVEGRDVDGRHNHKFLRLHS